jgi:hypothetical protein
MKIITITMLLCGAFCVDFGATASQRTQRTMPSEDTDYAEVQRRIARCDESFGAGFFKEVKQHLSQCTKSELIDFANTTGLPALDRLEQRNLSALICWYARNVFGLP